jgi:hypothetical protein
MKAFICFPGFLLVPLQGREKQGNVNMNIRPQMEVNDKLDDPTALPSGKSPQFPLDDRMSGHQS